MSVQFNDIEKLPATANETKRSNKWTDLIIALKIDVEGGKKIILKKVVVDDYSTDRGSLKLALDRTFGRSIFDIIPDTNTKKILYVRTNPHKG